MTALNATNARWGDAAQTFIMCDVTIAPGMAPIPFAASPSDTVAYGRETYEALIANPSAIAPFVAPTLSITELRNYASFKVYTLLGTMRAYPIATGVTINIDATSSTRTDLGDLATWGASNPSASQPWEDNSGIFTNVTGAQFVAVAPLVGAYALGVYSANAAVVQKIVASPPSITTTAEIDSYPWPV